MSPAPLSEIDILNMSDEDFLNTNPNPSLVDNPAPGSNEVEETPAVEVTEPALEGEVVATEPGLEEEVVTPATPVEDTRKRDAQGRFIEASVPALTPTEDATGKVIAPAKDPKVAIDPKVAAMETVPAVAQDYEGFFKKVMTPFKANGRTVELKTPEEAIQLMQMGANYTKKMQELVPHRKMMTMLQNNGLLDEAKLSYLIDLSQKNPEAIKKLVKDAGINPLDIDVDTESTYREGNHRVSDEEVQFHTVLEDMKSTPDRVGTLKIINDGWDDASKQALWKEPRIMSVIHDHRENGTYDRISNEIARRQTLGTIPVGIPFLQAYKAVGDEIYQAAVTPTAIAPVATRVAAPKPKVANGARAAAVSPNRSIPASTKGAVVDFLNMKDEDFLKQFEGRI